MIFMGLCGAADVSTIFVRTKFLLLHSDILLFIFLFLFLFLFFSFLFFSQFLFYLFYLYLYFIFIILLANIRKERKPRQKKIFYGQRKFTTRHNPEKSNFCGHLGWALFFFFSGLINANAIFQWSTGDGR